MRNNNENESQCEKYRKLFTEKCPQTWVVHFDRKFQYEKFKEQLTKEGYQRMDDKFDSTKQQNKNKKS